MFCGGAQHMFAAADAIASKNSIGGRGEAMTSAARVSGRKRRAFATPNFLPAHRTATAPLQLNVGGLI